MSLLYLVTLQIALAAFQLINSIMEGRAVYYKQKSENFFPPWTYIVGDILAFVPIPVFDIATFATMVYFMSGTSPPHPRVTCAPSRTTLCSSRRGALMAHCEAAVRRDSPSSQPNDV